MAVQHQDGLETILAEAKTVAVVGLSPDPASGETFKVTVTSSRPASGCLHLDRPRKTSSVHTTGWAYSTVPLSLKFERLWL